MEEVYMSEEYSEVPWDTPSNPLETHATSALTPDDDPQIGPSSSTSPTRQTLTTFGLTANNALKVTVTDAQKHGEGSSAFVTYAIDTKSTLPSFARSNLSTRRRFQDFAWLHGTLSEEYPACIIPPLPGKHRMEYITGDRFSTEFIEKRRYSLQTYINRVTRHPTLQNSAAIKKFLQPGDLQGADAVAKRRDSHVFESISDAILNVVSKVREPDPKFLEYKESVEKFEENLKTVERLNIKLLKEQSDLETDTADLHRSITTMASMETQISEPLSEFGSTLREIAKLLHEKTLREDTDLVGEIREYIAYSHSVKEVLKIRDQKQIDHEELERYLGNHIIDRERTAQGKGDGGILGLIKDKYNDFRNVNHEQARKAKLERLEVKIKELKEAVEQSTTISSAFSNEVIKEMDLFNAVKIDDFKDILRDYTESQMEYYEKGGKLWDAIIPMIENIQLDSVDGVRKGEHAS
ncbi:uncharacterized protein EV422DRAFT_527934 [Fimicolochytrium jonesii]|uniref:uncharacterized protein n=1 Tax=Fimicolochytrium jonesii TaxID=1396493 RepID=UPI0022FF357A|nr:uncharacterized protein EV422DRAFT_527934 [Fimicolochytrium jonesii]KAI8821365.1 hypothetical protein EV422DRAFT_527934 [Fimicolochytrium jonesii]